MKAPPPELYGYAAWDSLGNDPEDIRRALRVLSYVYNRASNTKSLSTGEKQKRIKEIEDLLTAQKAFDPVTFGTLPEFLAAGSDDPSLPANAESLENLWRAEMTVARPMFSIYGGLALDLAGVVLHPTLTYLSEHAQSGHDLTSNPFLPYVDDARLEALGAYAFERLSGLLDSQPGLKSLYLSPDIQKSLGVAPNLDDPSILARHLPEAVRDTASKAMKDDEANQLTQDDLDQLKDEIIDSVTESINELHERYQQIRDLRSQNARATQLAVTDFKAVNTELAGAVAVGTFVLDKLLKRTDIANGFQKVASATQQVYQAVNGFNLNLLGYLGLAGGLAEAATLIVGLFSNQDIGIGAALDKINKTLQDVEVKLTTIQNIDIEILHQLANFFRSQNLDNAVKEAQLLTITNTLDSYIVQYANQTRKEILKAFLSTVDSCWKIHKDRSKYTDHEISEKYSDFLTAFYEYATLTAKEPVFTKDPAINKTSSGDLDPVRLALQIKEAGHVDLAFALLPQAFQAIGVKLDFPSEYAPSHNDPVLPNPIAWAHGVNAYLEARITEPKVVESSDPDWLSQMWLEGLRLRKAILTNGYAYAQSLLGVGNYLGAMPVSVAPTADNFANLPHLVGEVYRIVKTFEDVDGHLTAPYSVKVVTNESERRSAVNHYLIDQVSQEGGYQDNAYLWAFMIPTPDPLQILLDNRILDLDFVDSYKIGHIRSTLYRLRWLKQLSGDPTVSTNIGVLLGGVDTFLREVSYDHQWMGVDREWYPHGFHGHVGGLVVDSRELLDQCFAIVRRHIDRPIVQSPEKGKGLLDYLRKNLIALQSDPSGNTLVQKFESSATIGRFFTALALWQNSDSARFTYELGPKETDLQNITGLYDLEAVILWLKNYIEHELPDSNSWALQIATRLQSAIMDTVKQSVAVFTHDGTQFDGTKTVPCVDETLRRLGSYMTIHDIPFLHPNEAEIAS